MTYPHLQVAPEATFLVLAKSSRDIKPNVKYKEQKDGEHFSLHHPNRQIEDFCFAAHCPVGGFASRFPPTFAFDLHPYPPGYAVRRAHPGHQKPPQSLELNSHSLVPDVWFASHREADPKPRLPTQSAALDDEGPVIRGEDLVQKEPGLFLTLPIPGNPEFGTVVCRGPLPWDRQADQDCTPSQVSPGRRMEWKGRKNSSRICFI